MMVSSRKKDAPEDNEESMQESMSVASSSRNRSGEDQSRMDDLGMVQQDSLSEDDEAQQRVMVARRVERAVTHAANGLRELSSAQVKVADNLGNDDDDEHGDTQSMYAQLDEARNSVLAACMNRTIPLVVDDSMMEHEDDDDDIKKMEDSHATFRAAYVDAMTQAFAQELEDMRQPPVSSGREDASSGVTMDIDDENQNYTGTKEVVMDVHALVDCLESGIHSWTTDERDLFLQSHASADHDDDEDQSLSAGQRTTRSKRRTTPLKISLTPHERRRQLLGFAS